MEKQQSHFIRADELSGMLGRGTRHAQLVIKRCNDELAAQGYIVFKGQCPREYVLERIGLKDKITKPQPKNGCDI